MVLNSLCVLSPPQGIEQSASGAVVPEALKVVPHLTIRLPSLGEIAFYSRNIGRHLRHDVSADSEYLLSKRTLHPCKLVASAITLLNALIRCVAPRRLRRAIKSAE